MSFVSPYPYSRCNVLNYSGFVLSSCFSQLLIRRVFCFSVSLPSVWCLLVRSRSWFVLEMFLIRPAVHTTSAVRRMGPSDVFPVVLDCAVACIVLVVGVGPRFLAPLVRFLIVLFHNPPLGRVVFRGILRSSGLSPIGKHPSARDVRILWVVVFVDCCRWLRGRAHMWFRRRSYSIGSVWFSLGCSGPLLVSIMYLICRLYRFYSRRVFSLLVFGRLYESDGFCGVR